MPDLTMEFYSVDNGVRFSVPWKDEREYSLAKEFLRKLLGEDGEVGRDAGKPPLYMFQSAPQRKAFFSFQRELRQSK